MPNNRAISLAVKHTTVSLCVHNTQSPQPLVPGSCNELHFRLKLEVERRPKQDISDDLPLGTSAASIPTRKLLISIQRDFTVQYISRDIFKRIPLKFELLNEMIMDRCQYPHVHTRKVLMGTKRSTDDAPLTVPFATD